MPLKDYMRLVLSEGKSSFRRYLVLGAFDGLIVSLSILLAVGNALNVGEVINAVTSGLIGVSAASFWNTLVAEGKEKELELRELERQMLRSLKGTVYEKSARIVVWVSSLVHALSPLIGFVNVLVFLVVRDLVVAGAVGIASISALGLVYEGDLREKARSVLIMTVAGIVTALLAVTIGH